MMIHSSNGFSSSAKPRASSPMECSNQDISKQILALARSGKTRQAVELFYTAFDDSTFRKGHQKQINTRMMNNAIGACARPFKPLYKEAFDIFHFGLEKGLRPNVYTFGSLMSVCAKRGDVTQCKSLMNQMRESGIKPNSVIYSTAISACERCSPPRSDLAIELLNESIKEGSMEGFMNIVGFNAAISVCARAGEWQQACQILDEMEGNRAVDKKPILDYDTFIPKPDEITYGTVMAACERAKEWHTVLQLSKRMETLRSDLEMDGMGISSALHACQQLGYGRDALNYIKKMKQLKKQNVVRRDRGNHRRKALSGPDDVAYRLAISACARGGLIQEALDLLNAMEKETGTKPDVAAYTAAIGGCVESGDYMQAFEILNDMKTKGVQPNVITYSAVISSCASASAIADKSQRDTRQRGVYYSQQEDALEDVQKPMRAAMKLLENMKNSKNKELEPNIVTYNASIRACAEGLDDAKAFSLLDELLQRGLKPTIVTFGSLMTACERVSNVDGVSRVFRLMREQNIEPNEIVFGAAISCYRKAKESNRTLALLRKMIELRLYPNAATFNTVLMAQIESKNMEKASAVFKLLSSVHSKRASPNRQSYNLIIKAMAENLQPANAEHYLHRMKEDGMKPDVDLLTAIVSSYERCKEPIKALKMMEAIREEGYDFYQLKIFDAAFKQGVKVINNVVGKGFVGSNSTPKNEPLEGDEE
jgi:pentatricopeptide repeat protein